MNNLRKDFEIKQLMGELRDTNERLKSLNIKYKKHKSCNRYLWITILIMAPMVFIMDYEHIDYRVIYGYQDIWPSFSWVPILFVPWLLLFYLNTDYFLKRKESVYVRVLAFILYIGVVSAPVWGVYTLNRIWVRKIEVLRNNYLKQSHVVVGILYKSRTPWRRGAYSKMLYVGIDESHLSEHKVSDDSPLLNVINVGDTVIIRVSDEYPCVTKVLYWHPTHDEIKKYKTPVKTTEE